MDARVSPEPLPRACQLVEAAGKAAGAPVAIRVLGQSTRTAEEAASACGCKVGQIVKSLVFRGKSSGKPILLLVSGANRVDESAIARLIGEKIERPDAEFVRAKTGFAIGGIPPFGHERPLATFMDEDLLEFPSVFAAAGTPNSIFEIEPRSLLAASNAQRCRVK
jgi:prolyl-tRNA editing enzyme YbaK/EbsC (Cys-tRNA(Pro) deacylase)